MGFFANKILDIMSDSEETVESLLLAASDAYESSQETTPSSASCAEQNHSRDRTHHHLPPPPTTTPSTNYASASAPPSSGRFAAPLTEQEIIRAQNTGIPEKTKRDTRFCLNTYSAWKKHREQHSQIQMTPLENMGK